MGQLVTMDPTLVITYMEDFFKFDPGEWIVTRQESQPTASDIEGTGASRSYEQVTDAAGGVLAVYTTIYDNDYAYFQYGGSEYDSTGDGPRELFTTVSGKKLWYKSRLKCNDVDTADFYTGLFVTDTSPVASAPSDGFWFISDDGDGYLDFHLYSSSASLTSRTAVATLSDDTFFDVGFYYDGSSDVHIFYNNREVASATGLTLSTSEMAVSFGIQNGSAAASTLSMDYICVIRER